MLKLGQRGWNNVLIFAMLFMVFLFSTSHKLLLKNSEQPSSMRLFPPYSVVMKIQFADVTLQRIGQDWRIDNNDYEVTTLVELLHRWEALEVNPTGSEPPDNPYVVTAYLAGEETPRVLSLFKTENGPVLRFEGNHYRIEQWRFNQMVPLSNK